MSDGYESVISKTGWGFCHYFVISLCAICTMTEAAASMIVLIVIPLLACEKSFAKQDTIILNATCSLGMAFGGLIFGTLADLNGRKIQIPTTIIMIFISLIGLSFSQTYIAMSLCIFFLGIGLAGNNIILRVYLIELLPSNQRGKCLAILDIFWTIGYTLALVLTWCMVPSIIQLRENEFRPSSWRILAAIIGGVPCLIVASIMTLLPSSPRYLIYQRRSIEALTVLKHIYAINNSQHADNYNANNLIGCVKPDDDISISIDAFNAIKKYFIKTWKKITLIFSPEFKKITFLFILIRLLFFPGLILMALLNTHLFNSHHINHNCLQISIDAADIILIFLNNCQNANNFYFKLYLIFSSSYFLAECLLVLGIDCVGRRLSLLISGLFAVTFVFGTLISTCDDEKARFILIFFFLLAYSVAYTTTNLMLLENYPTAIRATMMGLSTFLPHFTTFIIKLFARISSSMIRYIASGLLIGAVVSAIPIPDLTNHPMKE